MFYVLSGLFAALTAAGAFVRIPLPYVPITLQTFFVLLSGSVLGAKFGALSQLIYLAIGLSGVPVFSNGGGPGYVLQPTFGYLIAYPVAAYFVGYLSWGGRRVSRSKRPAFGRIVVANLCGILIIFAMGVTVLYLNLTYLVGKSISLKSVLWTGFVLFIPGDLIKIFLSSVTAAKLNEVVPV